MIDIEYLNSDDDGDFNPKGWARLDNWESDDSDAAAFSARVTAEACALGHKKLVLFEDTDELRTYAYSK
jgi:hypothetical protein